MDHIIKKVNISDSDLQLLVSHCPEDSSTEKYLKWRKAAATQYVRARLIKIMTTSGKMADYNIDVHKFDEDLKTCCIEKIRSLEKDLEDANVIDKDASEMDSVQKTYLSYREEIPRNLHWILHNDEDTTTMKIPNIRPLVFDPAHFPFKLRSSNLMSCTSTVTTNSMAPTIKSGGARSSYEAATTRTTFQNADINLSAQNSIRNSSGCLSLKKLSEIDCVKTPGTDSSQEVSSCAEAIENDLLLVTHKSMNLLLLKPCENKEEKEIIADDEIFEDSEKAPTASAGATPTLTTKATPTASVGVPTRKKYSYEISMLESIPEQDEDRSNSSRLNLEKTASSQGAIPKTSKLSFKISMSDNINCPITGCFGRLGISDSTFLAHIIHDHFGKDTLRVEIQETYADCDTVLVFDSGSIARYKNTALGMVIYHGKFNEKAPGNRNFCALNQFLPRKLEQMVASLPIMIMACKLPKNIHSKHDSEDENDVDGGTVILIWLLSTKTSKPLFSDIRVFNRKTAKAKSTRIKVRTLNQPQNVMDFLCEENDYTFVSNVDDKSDLVHVELKIQEL